MDCREGCGRPVAARVVGAIAGSHSGARSGALRPCGVSAHDGHFVRRELAGCSMRGRISTSYHRLG